MQISIEPFSAEFIDAAVKIEQECFGDAWSREMLEAELSNPAARFFAALVDGEAAGYAGMHCVCGECYIANVGVLKAYRRLGVASKLLAALEECALSENAEFITLEVRESNSAAISLYTRLGYTEAGLRKNYYTSPVEAAVLMTKYFNLSSNDTEL